MSDVNKILSRRVLKEVFSEGNLDMVAEIFSEDHVHHDPAMPEEGHGREHFKEFASMYRSAFPDINIEIEDQIAEGDKVVTRWTGTGTHEGELTGIAPTGNPVTLPGVEIVRISDGKLVEGWEGYDSMTMMRQLGVM